MSDFESINQFLTNFFLFNKYQIIVIQLLLFG